MIRMNGKDKVFIFKNTQQKFEEKFTKTNRCWVWNYGNTISWYPQISHHSAPFKAHRFSFLLYNGDIDEGLVVRHTCDNKRCVNPSHLILGTYKENSNDALVAGVQKFAIGEGCGSSRLNECQVVEIRELYSSKEMNQHELADVFCVSQSTINSIVNRKTWTHI